MAAFFEDVRRLVAVDLALGNQLYRDDQVLAFTCPDHDGDALRQALEAEIDGLAKARGFDTPPLCRLSDSTRSFIPMAKELEEVRKALSVPLHRAWNPPQDNATNGHVCPVCHLRFNDNQQDKQTPCKPCGDRRTGRLEAWQHSGEDTIWISEVADRNGRLALITLNFDLDPWLDGTHTDSLRSQSIPEWRRFNPKLKGKDNPVDPEKPFASLVEGIKRFVESQNKRFVENPQKNNGKLQDPLLSSLQDGFQDEKCLKAFFEKIVEDRAKAPEWDQLDGGQRAHWLAHQLFRKNAAPGRVHRFWRDAEGFFAGLLAQFREIASADANRWRTRRLVVKPAVSNGFQDRQTYLGRWRDAPLELLYREQSGDFITICNLARLLKPEERKEVLQGETIEVTGDDGAAKTLKIASVRDDPAPGAHAPVIPLEISPARFRVLVPLEAANACLDAAVARWERDFARLWDRMPLRAGAVAFPRLTPFQAVIEAARNLEDDLTEGEPEIWRVREVKTRDGVTALSLARADGGTDLMTMPVRLPDGRDDVFYPNLATTDTDPRHARDFQSPGDNTVYRHASDLAPGDEARVAPAKLALHFMESTAARFAPPAPRPLSDWGRITATWDLLRRTAPSLTALRAAWETLQAKKDDWTGPGTDDTASRAAWQRLARAVLAEQLEARGATLDALTEAAETGVLEITLDWHLRALKAGVEEKS